MTEINIKLPVLKAKIRILIGEYEHIKHRFPPNLDDFGDPSYLARTAYRRESGVKDNLPFHVVIHSRSFAMSVIAHEAVHAASFIQSGMGIHADFDNDELTAYIVQYICEIVEKKLNIYD